jgi:UDP-glucose 4-epimerase
MKALIVGGTSAFGSFLRETMKTDWEVTTAGRSGCEIQIDLAAAAHEVAVPVGLDVVIHTAAHFGGPGILDALLAENVNCLGTLKLCQAAANAGARHIVLVSSMSAALSEGSPYHGIYAISKRHGEDVARFACQAARVPLTILRPSQIYGPSDSFRRHQPFLYAAADHAMRGEDVVINGSRDPLRNYIYVDDVVTILKRVVSERIVGIYSCQHPVNVSLAQVSRAALKAFDGSGSVIFSPEMPDIPDNVFEIDTKLYEAVNYRPLTTIEMGLERIAQNR